MFRILLLPFTVASGILRSIFGLAVGAVRYPGPPLPGLRTNLASRLLAAAAIAVAAVDWASDNAIHPELAQRWVDPAIGDLLRGDTIFAFAVAALIGVALLAGTAVGDNIVLPVVGLLVGALQIGFTAGPGWIVVAAVLTGALLAVLWFLSLRISLLLNICILIGLAIVSGVLLVPPVAG